MLNFIQFISQNSPQLSTDQKVRLLDDFCVQLGYQEFLEDGVTPNPQSKTEFANWQITRFIKSTVEVKREMDARLTIEQLDL